MSEMRHTSSGHSMPRNYWQAQNFGPLDPEDFNSIDNQLVILQELARRHGFDSLFDAVLAMVRSQASHHVDDTRQFIKNGRLRDFYTTCSNYEAESIENTPANLPLRKFICVTSKTIYLQE